MDMDTVGKVALLGGEDEGEALFTLGKGWRPFKVGGGPVGLDGEITLALLLLLFRYSATLS